VAGRKRQQRSIPRAVKWDEDRPTYPGWILDRWNAMKESPANARKPKPTKATVQARIEEIVRVMLDGAMG
jgi:hypothetical protein